MTDFVTLSQAAESLGVTLRTIKRRAVTLGDTQTRLEGRRRLVSLSAISNGQNVPVPVPANKPKTERQAREEGIYSQLADFEYALNTLQAEHTETLRQLRETQIALERLCRNVSGLNAAVNDAAGIPARVAEVEAGLRWLENQRRNPETAVYGGREERSRAVDGVSERARGNRLVGALSGMFGGKG